MVLVTTHLTLKLIHQWYQRIHAWCLGAWLLLSNGSILNRLWHLAKVGHPKEWVGGAAGVLGRDRRSPSGVWANACKVPWGESCLASVLAQTRSNYQCLLELQLIVLLVNTLVFLWLAEQESTHATQLDELGGGNRLPFLSALYSQRSSCPLLASSRPIRSVS